MSYAIAPTFEANKIGVRRIYTLSGLGSTPDPDTIAELVANGYDPATLQTAVVQGATDEQLLALPYPADQETEDNALGALLLSLSNSSQNPTTASTMDTSLIGTIFGPLLPTTSSPSLPTVNDSPSAPSGTVGVPAGSVFTYIVQWATSIMNLSGPSQILAQVNNILKQQNISVISSSIPTVIVGQATGFTIVIQTTGAFAQVSDVKSICDGAVQQAGRSPVSSSLTVGNIPASTPSPISNVGTWFEQNWGMVAAVVVAVAVLPVLVRKL